jgi:hypothetical protein
MKMRVLTDAYLAKESEAILPQDERRGSYLPAVARHTTHTKVWSASTYALPFLFAGVALCAVLDALGWLAVGLPLSLVVFTAALWWAFPLAESNSTARSRGLGENGGG